MSKMLRDVIKRLWKWWKLRKYHREAKHVQELFIIDYYNENEAVVNLICKQGDLGALKIAKHFGYPLYSRNAEIAAANGHIKILQYLHENGCPWDEKLFEGAILRMPIKQMIRFPYFQTRYDNIFKCIQYAHRHGCSWDEHTFIVAAQSGYIDLFRYLHENGCPWDVRTTMQALRSHNYNCLVYAHDNGCPLPTYKHLKANLVVFTYAANMFPILEPIQHQMYKYLKEHAQIHGVCIKCALHKQEYNKICWENPSIWYCQAAWKYLKARCKIMRAMEHAYINPRYAWCINRLHRDCNELNKRTICDGSQD